MSSEKSKKQTKQTITAKLKALEPPTFTAGVFMDVCNHINEFSMQAWNKAALDFNMSIPEIERAYNTGVAKVINAIQSDILFNARPVVLNVNIQCDVDLSVNDILEAVCEFNQITQGIFKVVSDAQQIPTKTLISRYEQGDTAVMKLVNDQLVEKATDVVNRLQLVSAERKQQPQERAFH